MKASLFRPALAASVLLALCGSAGASSHREAPFITTVPKVDASDFYMFRSYEAGRMAYTTLIANYRALQNPALIGAASNSLDKKNVTTLALEVPTACLVPAERP